MLETNVEFWAAVVLDIAEIPPEMYPAMFGCARVAGWSAHIVEQRRTGRLIRPSARYVGAARALAGRRRDARRGGGAGRRARRGRATSGSSRCCAAHWDEELEAAARSQDFRERAVAYRAIAQFRFRQKIELLRRGLEDESPACRGSALLSLEALSRDHPGRDQRRAAAAARARRPRRQRGRAAAGGRRAAERLADQRDTIEILAALGEDDEQGRELREAAAKVAQALRRKAGGAARK